MAAGPTLQISPPLRVSRRGGIEAVADFRTNDRLGAAAGVSFQSDGCAFPQESQHLCYVDGTPVSKTFAGVDIIDGIVDPFVIYAGSRCFMGPNPDFAERALRTLKEGRYFRIEQKLGTWLAGGTALSAADSIAQAIANVEQALDSQHLGEGIIVMSSHDAVLAGSERALFEGPDGLPTTINGTRVLVSGAFAPGVIYGSGAIVVEESAPETFEALQVENNTHWAMAEQIFALAVDCAYRVKSTVTLGP